MDEVATARGVCFAPMLAGFSSDFGAAPDPAVWSAGAPVKKARLQEAVCEFAAASGRDSLGRWDWCCIPGPPLSRADFDAWPYFAGPVVKFSAFLGSLACWG